MLIRSLLCLRVGCTQATGGFDAGGAKPDDLAAIQVTPGSPDWILAKVISHDPETGIYKLSDEDVESNKSELFCLSLLLLLFQDGSGNRTHGLVWFDSIQFIGPGLHLADFIDLPLYSKPFIHETHSCGPQQQQQQQQCTTTVFHLPEPQVVVLGHLEKLSRGDVVYAVYPDTTSFYQATIVQAPRKAAGGNAFVMVNFLDDSDEHGITHDKAVLFKHVMRPPHGAVVVT